MRTYGQVQCSWWGHHENKTLSNEAKILYLYILTGPHSNGLGCYRLPTGYIESDTGFSEDEIDSAYTALGDRDILYRCKLTDFVAIRNFLRWNTPVNKKVALAREREFMLIPSSFPYIDMVANDIIIHGGTHFSQPFLDSIRNRIRSRSDTVSDQDFNGLDTVVRARSETVSKQEHNITEHNLLKDPSPGMEFSGGMS